MLHFFAYELISSNSCQSPFANRITIPDRHRAIDWRHCPCDLQSCKSRHAVDRETTKGSLWIHKIITLTRKTIMAEQYVISASKERWQCALRTIQFEQTQYTSGRY